MAFIALCGSYFDEYEEIFKKYLSTNIELMDDLSTFIAKEWKKILLILFTDEYKSILEKNSNLVNIIVKRNIFSIFLNSVMNLAPPLRNLIAMDFSWFVCSHNIDRNFGEYNWSLNGIKIPIPYFGYFKAKNVTFTQKIDIVHADLEKILSFIVNRRIFISSLHIPIFLLVYMPGFVNSIMKHIFDKLGLEIPLISSEENLIFQLDELIFDDIQRESEQSLAYIMDRILSSFVRKEYSVNFEKKYKSSLEKLRQLNVLNEINENDEILVEVNEKVCNRIIKLSQKGYRFKTLGFIVKGVMEE